MHILLLSGTYKLKKKTWIKEEVSASVENIWMSHKYHKYTVLYHLVAASNSIWVKPLVSVVLYSLKTASPFNLARGNHAIILPSGVIKEGFRLPAPQSQLSSSATVDW